MSRSFFTALPDWTKLKTWLEEQMIAHRDAALETSAPTADLAFAAREYERGWYDALRSVLELPDLLLKDGDGEETPEPPAEGPKLHLAPEQATSRPHKLSRPF